MSAPLKPRYPRYASLYLTLSPNSKRSKKKNLKRQSQKNTTTPTRKTNRKSGEKNLCPFVRFSHGGDLARDPGVRRRGVPAEHGVVGEGGGGGRGAGGGGGGAARAGAGAEEDGRRVQWVFLGCPGVGKGTYASRLSQMLRVPHIATGDLVRDALASPGPFSEQVKRRLRFSLPLSWPSPFEVSQ